MTKNLILDSWLFLLVEDKFKTACKLPQVAQVEIFEKRFKNFGIELFSQEVPLQVFSSIYNVSQLSSVWISVVPLNTLKTPKQKSTF